MRFVASRLGKVTVAAFVAAATIIACDSPVAPPASRPTGRVAVFAAAGNTGVTSLVISVTGPGIVKLDGSTPDTLVFNLAMTNGVASGSLDIPAGAAREFVVRAYTGITETHHGELITDIAAGNNPTVSITLYPVTGSVPLTLTMGSLLVFVQPDSVYLGLGDTLRVTAQVRDNKNNSVAPQVVWGSSNSGRATVDPAGLVTIRDTGAVYIIATQGGVSGMARLYGRRFPGAGTSYTLVWDGSKNRAWSDTANWTAQSGDAARVPTPADSVIVPAGISNQPQLDVCAPASVRDLVMEQSATLGSGCGSASLRIYGHALNANVTALVDAQSGAVLSGSFAGLRVASDSVSLGGNATATQLDLVGNGRLTLGGHALSVWGAAQVGDSARLVMTSAADTLDVRGNLTVGDNARNTIDAGVIRLGASFTGSRGWNPTSGVITVFDGTAGQDVSLGSGAARMTWPNVHIANAAQPVRFLSNSTDTISYPQFAIDSATGTVVFAQQTGSGVQWLTPAGGTLQLGTGGLTAGTTVIEGGVVLPPAVGGATPGISGNTLRVIGGSLVVGANAVVNVNTLTLDNATVTGPVASGQVFLVHGTSQQVAAGVAAFSGAVTVQDSSTLTAGAGTGHVGGALVVADSAHLVIAGAGDTLDVRGNLTVSDKARNTLTAGVIRLGASFTGSLGWNPGNGVTTLLDGASGQDMAWGSNAAKLSWPNVHVLNGAAAVRFLSSSTDTLSLPGFAIDTAGAGLVFSQQTGSGWIRVTPAGGTLALGTGGMSSSQTIVDGSVTLPAASATVTPNLNGNTLRVVNGTFTVGTGALVNIVTLVLDHATVAGRLGAFNVYFTGGSHQTVQPDIAILEGNVSLRDSSVLTVGAGTSVISGTLTLADSSALEMLAAADTLSVRGSLTVSDKARNTLTNGALRLGASFTGSYGWQPAGSLVTIFDGTNSQDVLWGSGNARLTWPRIHIANATQGVRFLSSSTDTLFLPEFAVDSAKTTLVVSQLTGSGAQRITPAGGTLQLGMGGLNTDHAIIDGSVVLPPASGGVTPTINGNSLRVANGTLTVGAGALVSVITLVLEGAHLAGNAMTTQAFLVGGTQQTVQPGVASFGGSVTVQDTSRLTVGPGTSVIPGTLTLQDWGGLYMTAAADTLSVRGSMTVSDNAQSSTTAGTLRLGASFNGAYGWHPVGSLTTVFDGTITQDVSIGSGALTLTWPNIHIANASQAVRFLSGSTDTITYGSFVVDSAKAALVFSQMVGNGVQRIIPAGGTLRLGTGGIYVGQTIVEGNVVLPPTPGGGVVPSITGSWLTVRDTLTTGVGSNVTSNVKLYGVLQLGGSNAMQSLEMAGDLQTLPPRLDLPPLVVSGHLTLDGQYLFNGSGSITSTGVLDVTTGSMVQFGRYFGANFTMVSGAQLNNQGTVRFTNSGGWTTPVGASVIGNAPASTAPAHVVIVTPSEATGMADSAVHTMPTVRVLDPLGYPVKGATVNFTSVRGSSQLTGVAVVTNTNGLATLGTWKLGPTATRNTISADVSGATGVTMSVDASYAERVMVGKSAACAATNGSTNYCWGDARAWQFGAAATAFGSDTAYAVPTATGLSAFSTVALGAADHLCSIAPDNSASCWGASGSGQLGDGTDGSATGSGPTTVAGGIAWAQLSRGPNATCGVSTSGVGYCWGVNSNGILGNSAIALDAIVNTPSAIDLSAVGNPTLASIAVGYQHACAISTAGAIFCWGNNDYGQVGHYGAVTGAIRTPIGIAGPSGWTSPGAAVQISAAGNHTCIISAGQQAWCWGLNSSGELGDASFANRSYPVLVSPGGLYFTHVTTGAWSSLAMPTGLTAPSTIGAGGFTCALSDDGRVFCWGYNAFGQLGEGTNISRNAPTQPVGGGGLHLNAITAGEGHVCGNRGQNVWCWGAGKLGQLGNNTRTDTNWPVRVNTPF